MTKSHRILLFLITLALLVLIFYLTKGSGFLSNDQSFVTLFLEHFFTTPTDVLASTIAILLLISPLRDQLSRFGKWYWIFFEYNVLLLLTSLVTLLLADQNRPSTT